VLGILSRCVCPAPSPHDEARVEFFNLQSFKVVGSGDPSALRQQHDYNDNSDVINGRHGVAAAVLAAFIEYSIQKCFQGYRP
jgi:hypothetical protein